MNGYLRDRKPENGVYNDLPKFSAGGAINQLWEDGDYNDVVKGMNADYEFNQATLNAKFKPSNVYQFMRADAERYTDETIKDYFASKYEDKEEQKRQFMMDYGVSPADAEEILRRQKITVAEAALKEFVENKRPMRPQGLRIDSIARNFMRNDVPMIEANDYFGPDGNLQPGITGISLGTRAEMRPVRTRRLVQVMAEEDVRDRAIDGLPVIPVSQAEKEMRLQTRIEQLDKGLAKVKADKQAKKEMLVSKGMEFAARRERAAAEKATSAVLELTKQTRRYAAYREEAEGAEKARVVQEFMEVRPSITAKGKAERLLKESARMQGIATRRGRPAGSPAVSPGAGEK
jgi:hypothetical protein